MFAGAAAFTEEGCENGQIENVGTAPSGLSDLSRLDAVRYCFLRNEYIGLSAGLTGAPSVPEMSVPRWQQPGRE